MRRERERRGRGVGGGRNDLPIQYPKGKLTAVVPANKLRSLKLKFVTAKW